ncbi:MAG TPA: hypothetical protein VMZ27_02405, partial [Candidatus Saccharimonadales bacterium]|nr:hypothetical protein [Candidatus Saccharimonadales bacterium]
MKPLLATFFALLIAMTAKSQVESPAALVTGARSRSATAAGGSFAPMMSADGHSIVFVSQSKTLVPKPNPSPYLDVFVRNLLTGQTTLVSANTNGGAGGNANSAYPTISSNGQFVAFESSASNLAPGNTNQITQIFLRNLGSQTTTLVSRNPGGTDGGDANSSNPQLLYDGRYAVFESEATNLVSIPLACRSNIFRRDLQLGITSLVSINAQGTAGGNDASQSPSVSINARWVAFTSFATNLVSGATNGTSEIYVRDLDSSATIWVSSKVTNYISRPYGCFNPVISADGQFVAFTATNSSPYTSAVFRFSLVSGNLDSISTNAVLRCAPEIDANGRFVGWETSSNACVWDSQFSSNIVLSAGTGPFRVILFSMRPILSPASDMVAFLGLNDSTNSALQLFVKHLPDGTNRCISLNRFGAAGADLAETVASWNWTGTALAFESSDPQTVSADYNEDSDIFYRDLSAATNILVSALASNSATPGGYNVLSPGALAAPARYVLFGRSDNPGTLPGIVDTNGLMDLFVWDASTSTNLPVSTSSNGSEMAGADPYSGRMSEGGRYVVFASESPAIAGIDTNNAMDVFRRDLLLGTNVLVSANSAATRTGNASSLSPSISDDGRWVAFQSSASDLIPNTSTYGENLFVRDMVEGTNILIGATGWNFTHPNVGRPVLSPDGHLVAFLSAASGLATNSTSGSIQVYIRDLAQNKIWLVSAGPSAMGFTQDCRSQFFSRHANTLVYASSNSLYYHDVAQRTTTAICSNCQNAALNGDGLFVAYETNPQFGSARQIVFQNLLTGATNWISLNASGTDGGDQDSSSPLVTHDGRYVVFASRATNLVANDTNGFADIFVRDVRMNTTLLLSRNFLGTFSGNGPSSRPFLGADGRTVLFQSLAVDLTRFDYNSSADIFILKLASADTDDDGMDDDWEMV